MARNVANVEVLPVANVANGQLGRRGPLRGTGACYRDRRDHRDCAWEVLRARNRLAGFARAGGWERKHSLRVGQWLGAAAWLAISRRSRWSRWSRPAR